MIYELPELNYAYNALEPFIDAQTMEIHHSKHHATYVAKLNEALAKHSELSEKNLTELLSNLNEVSEDIRTAVRNNGGGHLNHSIFWESLTPTQNSKEPIGELKKKIDETFTDFTNFKAEFTKAALARFGSGWVWIVMSGDKLEIVSTANQDNPIMQNQTPILGIDVWEHAYYLKYQNRRQEYLDNIWNVIDWNKVSLIWRSNS